MNKPSSYQLIILMVSVYVLNACTSYTGCDEQCCDGQAFPGMCWTLIARSPEVVLTERLNRGIDDHGNLIYATRLVDGSFIAMRGQDDSFGEAYFFRQRLKDGVIRTGTFTVPDGNEPLGVVYVHVADKRFLAVCHHSAAVGLDAAGSYRVTHVEGNNHISYEILRYQDQSIPYRADVEAFSIAEKGFCVDRDGTLLWPGDLDQGDVYDLELWWQKNEEASNGL